ncbi:MAG: cell wall-binding protein, partial [Candidatus Poseidoniia archaeon]|nr:cell wall-binding protein [Candidatus Poseidoniia archaeon]
MRHILIIFSLFLFSFISISCTSSSSSSSTTSTDNTTTTGLFVTVGQSGTILTSPDGTTWTSGTSGTT